MCTCVRRVEKSATRLYCRLCRPCAENLHKYSAKPSNSKYLLPLTALPDMPLHYLRAQYAQDLYRYFAEQGYNNGEHVLLQSGTRKGQAYDKGILLAVSQQMGHSRCDVVVSHYLY